MLQRTALISFFLLGLVIAALCGHLYRSLPQLSRSPLKGEAATSTAVSKWKPIDQYRAGVVKDLWMADEEERRHHQIRSGYSVLKLIPEKRGFKLIEKLHDVTGLLQEKVERESESCCQQLRLIEAEKGVYDYRTHTFFSGSMYVALAKLPGEDLPLTMPTDTQFYAQGIAREATFFLITPTPRLQAKTLRAKIDH
ncbi:MAG: hypothetical protein AAF443_07160 [Chlamydiota bacterium]